MDVKVVADRLWAHRLSYDGVEALEGQLNLDQAYKVQFDMLRRRLAEGERLAGWKIGGNSNPARATYGIAEPIYGYLLASGERPMDQPIDLAALGKPVIEIELAFKFAVRLAGPGVDRAQVLDALASAHPAAEIADLRTPARDLPLLVADDIAQWGYVIGAPVSPYPRDVDLGAEEVEIAVSGEFRERLRGRDVIDEQIGGLAYLANHLGKHGCAIEPGQVVITGSCNRPAPVKKGELWDARFSTFGSVQVQFS